MDCDCTVTTTAGVALVSVRLRNPTPASRRVRVENRLAGPVLPPRTAGVPDAGWDGEGVSVVVRPRETRPLGYACPLDTRGDDTTPDTRLADPPAVVVDDERVPAGDGPGPRDPPHRRDADDRLADADDRLADAADRPPDADPADRSLHAVVRDLGRPAPPRDAVPAPDSGLAAETDTDTDAPGRSRDEADTGGVIALRDTSDDETATDHGTPDDTLPPPVAAWLTRIERRVETAERLGPDTAVSTATEALAELDCPPATLPTRLAEDQRRLRALADRLDRLADRAESATVPADHLRRLS